MLDSLRDTLNTLLNDDGITIGLALEHLQSGDTLAINGERPFPMASVFKIPILATAFMQVEAGKLVLSQRIALTDEVKSLGSGILPYFQAGLAPTVYDLLTLMIIISDNTATDMTIDLLGGPAVIEQAMHDLGLTDIYFKLNCKDLLWTLVPADKRGLPREQLIPWLQTHDIVRDDLAFSQGPDNNVSTPRAMTDLVAKIYKAEFVSAENRDRMLEIMSKQQYNDRLPRFLPSGTRFDHKTGTIGGIRNDSGVMYVNAANHIAVTLFSDWDQHVGWDDPLRQYQRIFQVETLIGSIGRAIYDHFAAAN